MKIRMDNVNKVISALDPPSLKIRVLHRKEELAQEVIFVLKALLNQLNVHLDTFAQMKVNFKLQISV